MKGIGRYLVLTAMSLSAFGAAAADADLLREMADRVAIEQLMWDYTRALDTLDADAYAAVYTADGEFGSGANASKGSAALKEMINGVRRGREEREAKGEAQPAMYHMTANHHIEFIDADHARVHSYWMTTFGAVGRDVPARVAAVGRGIDDLVRVNGKWLIKTRNVAPQD
ncbi:MAG: nuclear transport factor 2 family protein [Gammaproteobacteria bacterium]|nr:nuclear transport factor 2 family protein [Gammaproteobacteria bacterium]